MTIDITTQDYLIIREALMEQPVKKVLNLLNQLDTKFIEQTNTNPNRPLTMAEFASEQKE